MPRPVGVVRRDMLEGPLRLFAIAASLAVLLSFALFAIDEARSGSEASQAGIARQTLVQPDDPAGYATPTPAQEKLREAQHGPVREAIDDADDVLLSPFAFVTEDSGSAWTRRGIPALIGLAVYGFGVGFLARFAAGRA